VLIYRAHHMRQPSLSMTDCIFLSHSSGLNWRTQDVGNYSRFVVDFGLGRTTIFWSSQFTTLRSNP
jgi:hypothetical protein